MAITTNAIANSFKKELLEAKHNFTQTPGLKKIITFGTRTHDSKED